MPMEKMKRRWGMMKGGDGQPGYDGLVEWNKKRYQELDPVFFSRSHTSSMHRLKAFIDIFMFA